MGYPVEWEQLGGNSTILYNPSSVRQKIRDYANEVDVKSYTKTADGVLNWVQFESFVSIELEIPL